MRFLILVVFGLQLICGQTLQQSTSSPVPRTINLRNYCTTLHNTRQLNGKFNFTCDGGSKHFKEKNLFLDSTYGATGIELHSFESVTIASKATSNWETLKKITIRRCKKVIINLESSLRLGELEIDSVDEVLLKTEHSGYNVTIKVIILSNTKKLDYLTDAKNADIYARELYLTNITDVDVYGNLQLAGELLTISQSNVGVTKHSMLFLKFASITTKDSSKLYIEERSYFNISTDNFLIQESEIYIYGQVNIKGYENLENRKAIKFVNNSFYGIKEKHLHIYGDKNKIEFFGNGIYKSDIGDVLNSLSGNKDVILKNNRFGCNECYKHHTIQTKYLEYLEGNFCDLTCNLTLSEYKMFLDQELICNKVGDSYVDGKILCSTHPKPMKIELQLDFVKWIVVPVGVVSALLLSVLTYFFCKRHSPRFQPIAMGNPALPENVQSGHEQSGVSRAYSNEIYGFADDGYEVVDLPT